MGRKKNKAGSDKKKASERLKLRRDVLYTLADDSLEQVAGGAYVRDEGSLGSMCRPTGSRGL